MAIKISVSKEKKSISFLSKLPRFSLDLRINDRKIIFQYVPVIETLFKMYKEKKGIIEISKKQFNQFNKKSSSSSKINVFNP
jgi:hypothetical protein